MSARILVTGSRFWTDRDIIRDALRNTWHDLGCPTDAILDHGASPVGGADWIAEDIWVGQGFPVERHPADRDPVTGRLLGAARNARMVALRPARCLGFVLAGARNFGTRNCLRLARANGIPITVFRA